MRDNSANVFGFSILFYMIQYKCYTYLFQVHIGIKGFVSDQSGQALQGAVVAVQHHSQVLKSVTTYIYGDYWRLLLPGEYTVTISSEG